MNIPKKRLLEKARELGIKAEKYADIGPKDAARVADAILREEITADPEFIKKIPEPSPELLELAFSEGLRKYTAWGVSTFMPSLTEKMKRALIELDSTTIYQMKEVSEELALLALKGSPYAIKFIKNPTESQQMMAVKKYPDAISEINNPTPKVQRYVAEVVVNNAKYYGERKKISKYITDPEALQVLRSAGKPAPGPKTKFLLDLWNNSEVKSSFKKVGESNIFDGTWDDGYVEVDYKTKFQGEDEKWTQTLSLSYVSESVVEVGISTLSDSGSDGLSAASKLKVSNFASELAKFVEEHFGNF